MAQHRRTLSLLLRQQAQQGGEHFAAPGVVAGISEARAAIAQLKAQLRSQGQPPDDQPGDERYQPDQPPIFPGPHQLPADPPAYVKRRDVSGQFFEDAVRATLLAPAAPLLTMVYGLSGVGKSTLAAYVVRRLGAAEFPDGILWGDLANSTPNDQVLQFLGALDSRWYHSGSRTAGSLRAALWQGLRERRALLVLDNIADARQLTELLPPDALSAGASRVLALSIVPLYDALLPTNTSLHLRPFDEAETLELFRGQLSAEQVAIYEPRLREIGQRLEYLPQLLAIAAREFAAGTISPNGYAQLLRQPSSPGALAGGAMSEGVELAFRDLPPDQIELAELLAVIGAGDWRETMLAAIALRPLAEVRQVLDRLVQRGLLQLSGNRRYRANTLIREYAQRRFSQRSAFRRQAAATLLAHYCLDLAYDTVAALRARPDLRPAPGQPGELADTPFVRAFREALLPEMAHLRATLAWAEQHEAWDLLRRFAQLPYLEILTGFRANGFELNLALSMATLIEPLIDKRGTQLELHISTLIAAADWSLRQPAAAGLAHEQIVNAADLALSDPTPPQQAPNCELQLELTASQVIDGIFLQMSLVNTRWVAVRATGLICAASDVVGGTFLACDLSQSVWLGCDARHAALPGSNLSYALLRNLKLRSANLAGCTLDGAVLEAVDLRDANLQGASLVGAVLQQVDLRGADLRGADLSTAELQYVNLVGCRLEGVRWAGAQLTNESLIVEDHSFQREIWLAAQVVATSATEQIHRRERRAQHLSSGTSHTALNADLRAAELGQHTLAHARLAGADLRVANLRAADLRGANLSNADLRAADLHQADASGANLSNADLRAATLSQATLTRADMRSSLLRQAWLDNARLEAANLAGADLRAANLAGANLADAQLDGANLTMANADQTRLSGASLHHTRLDGTSLRHADLSHTSFTGATGREISMQHANLSAAHLSGTFHQADLRATDLSQAELSGDFVDVDLSQAQLTAARLSGTFSRVRLHGATLEHAALNGVFSWAEFTQANLQAASLVAASLVNADLTGAAVDVSQLSQAARLRGSILPDGQLYDGRYQLPGDLADAQALAYNLDDPADQAAFYQRGRIRPKNLPGQL